MAEWGDEQKRPPGVAEAAAVQIGIDEAQARAAHEMQLKAFRCERAERRVAELEEALTDERLTPWESVQKARAVLNPLESFWPTRALSPEKRGDDHEKPPFNPLNYQSDDPRDDDA